jgi:hypothetical protein
MFSLALPRPIRQYGRGAVLPEPSCIPHTLVELKVGDAVRS